MGEVKLYNAHTCRQVIPVSDRFGGGASAFFRGTSHVPTLEAIESYESQLLVGAFQKAIIDTEYCDYRDLYSVSQFT